MSNIQLGKKEEMKGRETHQHKALDSLVLVVLWVSLSQRQEHLDQRFLLPTFRRLRRRVALAAPALVDQALHELIPLLLHRHQLLLHSVQPHPPQKRQELADVGRAADLERLRHDLPELSRLLHLPYVLSVVPAQKGID